MKRRATVAGKRAAFLALAVIEATLAGGCDLSYLTEGPGGSGTTGTPSSGGGGMATTSTTGGAGGAGGMATTTSGTGTGTSTGTGTGPEPTALVASAGFGDSTTDEVKPLYPYLPAIRVVPFGAEGGTLVAFHAVGTDIRLPGFPSAATDSTEPDLFLALFDEKATLVKVRHLAMPGRQQLGALVAAGPDGPFYVGGLAAGAMTLPEIDGGAPFGPGGDNGFVLRVDQDLAVTAAALMSGADQQFVEAMFLDATGDLWLGGRNGGTVGVTDVAGVALGAACPPVTYSHPNNRKGAFVARLDGALTACEQLFTFGQESSTNVSTDASIAAIQVDDAMNLHLAGQFGGKMAVGPAPAIQNSGDAGFVVKIAADGVSHWSAATSSGGGQDRLRGLALTADSVLVVGPAGYTESFHWVSPGGTQQSNPDCVKSISDSDDGMVVALDPLTGACQWGHRLHGPVSGTEDMYGVALDPDGHPWIAGHFAEALFMNGAAPYQGLGTGVPDEAVVLRFDDVAAGTVSFAQAWSGNGNQVIRSMAFLPGGRMAVVGMYTGSIPGGAEPLPAPEGTAHDYFLVILDPALPPHVFP